MSYAGPVAGLVALVVLAPPAQVTPEAFAAAPAAPVRYCRGERATIVGTPGGNVRGTAGADVIVTHGAYIIQAGGGDDLLCITGADPVRHRTITVFAESGNDRIDASDSQAPAGVFADPGPGHDTFLGHPGVDIVRAVGEGSDTISTGAGDDQVSAGGKTGGADHDVIHLGPGNDAMGRTRDPTTRWYGGKGVDILTVPADGNDSRQMHDWVYDNVRHAVFRDGVAVQRWQGFEQFEISGTPGGTARGRSIRFVGGPGPETVILAVNDDQPTRVSLGGGNDRLEAGARNYDGDSDFPGLWVLTGGPGLDLFRPDGGSSYPDIEGRYNSTPYIAVDLANGTFKNYRGTGPVDLLEGFEGVEAFSYDEADLTGTDGSDLLASRQSCTGHLTGGGGDDVLALGAMRDSEKVSCDHDGQPGPDAGATLDGGAGDDVLTGGYANDTLTGGDGTDTADGGPGTDACTAETTTNCEGS